MQGYNKSSMLQEEKRAQMPRYRRNPVISSSQMAMPPRMPNMSMMNGPPPLQQGMFTINSSPPVQPGMFTINGPPPVQPGMSTMNGLPPVLFSLVCLQ